MNLISESTEKPYTKPLLAKRKGTQVSYQYLRSNMETVVNIDTNPAPMQPASLTVAL